MDVAAETQERSRTPAPPENGVALGSESGDLQDKNPVSDNKFQQAISSWRNIDLTKLVPNLDTTASDLVAHQRDALVERKDLAQKTKDFRKLDDSTKLTEVKGLLKAYQAYIDLISNQSKAVHNSFLQVYSLLSEAPDPYPLLEASVESLVTADETVPKLEAENKHLQTSISKLTSQLEDTELKLQDETKLRKRLQDESEAKAKEVESSWSAVLSEKQDNWSAKEKSLEERAENQERLLKELKASYEVSQRMDKGGDTEASGQNSASAAELEIVSSDLERASLRLADVEARNEQMRLELAQKASTSSIRSVPVEEDPAYVQLRSENSSLMRKMESLRIERDSDKREIESSVRSLKREVTSLTEDRDSLRSKMHKWSDYEDVKRELEVLRSIEFAGGNEDENEDADAQSTDGQRSQGAQELEKLLMARNKKLNDELTVLRVSHQELNSQVDLLRSDLKQNSEDLEKSRQLISTLENDLANVQHDAPPSGPAMSAIGTYTSRHPNANTRRGRASPTSSIISGFDGPRSDGMGGGSGMLPMITAQRDRFKKRITELETEGSKSYQTIASLRSEIAALQKDNLNLYEKTRYVSSYGRSQPATAATLNPNPSTVQMPENGTPLDNYKSAYESKVSPFAAFRGHESMRALKRMSLPERAFLQTTKVVLRNRLSRNIFALYFLGIHIILISMMYSYHGISPVVSSKPLVQPGLAASKDKDDKR